VTNPNNPTLIGQWTIGRDGGLAFGSPDFAGDPGLPPGSDCTPPPGTPALCRGNDYPAVFLHDVLVSADRLTAYLAYWDGGVVILDVSDPAAPAFVGRGQVPATFGSDEGNTHSAAPASPNLLLLADEDFTAGPWGFVRIFDITNPASPTQVGAFATLRTMANPPPDAGWYTAHHPMVQGSVAYVGWYSDGVHVFDFSNPAQPKEVASFQPPNVPDPNGVLPPNALVWSAHPHGETVLAADMNAGLYILGYDNDGDGCGDLQEASSNQVRGGRRDPASFWDFFDMPTGPAALRDRRVTIGDITAVVARFGSTGSPSIDPLSPPPRAPGYHTAYDRTPTPSGDPWVSAAPNGGVSIQDIVLAVAQFGHTCA